MSSGVTSVSAHENSTCAVKSGRVYCWGANTYGQLGTGGTDSVKTPTAVAGITGAVGVNLGVDATYAWDAAGHVWAWGQNATGQLGTGDEVTHLTPVAVSIH